MAMGLYSHNRTAYEKAVAMLASTGKAAVIHPTGKSFGEANSISSGITTSNVSLHI